MGVATRFRIEISTFQLKDFVKNHIGARWEDSTPWRYLRELWISTTSLVWEPRASASWWPSFDQAKLKIWPAVKSVNCLGGPPSRGCAQIFATPCWSRM